jgi:hypothetical protein
VIHLRKINTDSESVPVPGPGRVLMYIDQLGAIKKKDDQGLTSGLAGAAGSNGAGFVFNAVATQPIVSNTLPEKMMRSIAIPSSVLLAGDVIEVCAQVFVTAQASGAAVHDSTNRVRLVSGSNAAGILTGLLGGLSLVNWKATNAFVDRPYLISVFIAVVSIATNGDAVLSVSLTESEAGHFINSTQIAGFDRTVNVSSGLIVGLTHQMSAGNYTHTMKAFRACVYRWT